MYFRVNLKVKKPTLSCCFTWIVFIERNFTVAFLLIRKRWGDEGFEELGDGWYPFTDYVYYILLDPSNWGQGLSMRRICRVCPSVHPSVRPSNGPSIHLSFRVSGSFLRIDSLVFSETEHGVTGPYIVTCDSRIFWKNSPPGKNNQKWPKNRVFRFFKKIMSLVLSGICVKRKFLWFINNLHAWEKSGSQVLAKNCSRPMRFQYSLIINISLIDEYLTFGTEIDLNERNKTY